MTFLQLGMREARGTTPGEQSDTEGDPEQGTLWLRDCIFHEDSDSDAFHQRKSNLRHMTMVPLSLMFWGKVTCLLMCLKTQKQKMQDLWEIRAAFYYITSDTCPCLGLVKPTWPVGSIKAKPKHASR